MKELGWLAVKELIEMETAMMVYRSINEEAPNYLTAYSIGYQILELESFVILIQTSSCFALKLAVINGALLTEGHNYGITFSAEVKKAPTLSRIKSAYKNSK